jgi:hypothetical protein
VLKRDVAPSGRLFPPAADDFDFEPDFDFDEA